ncbi:MAG: hypothetical protein ACRDF4_08450 [Rhabdochlamydiaceae bacterium]
MPEKAKKQGFIARLSQNMKAQQQKPSKIRNFRAKSKTAFGKGSEYLQKGKEYGRVVQKYTKGDGMKNMGKQMRGQMDDLTRRASSSNPMARKRGIRNQ